MYRTAIAAPPQPTRHNPCGHPNSVSTAGREHFPETDLKLRVTGPGCPGRIVQIRSSKCTIGSAVGCTLRLHSRHVPRLACWIVRGKDKIAVRRFEGCPTVNGAAFELVELKPGDRLLIGNVELELLPPDAVAPAAEPGEWTPGREQGRDGRAANETDGRESIRQIEARLEEALQKVAQLEHESHQGFQASILAAERADQLHEALAAAHDELQATAAELAQTQGELAQTKQQLTQAQAKCEQTRAELARSRAELVQTQSERDRLRKELQQQASQTQDTARQAELAARAAELATRETQLVQRQAELEARQRDLEARDADLKARLAALETQTTTHEKRLAEVEQQEAKLRARAEQLDAQAAELAEQAAALEQQRAELESRAKELDSQAATLEARERELRQRGEELDRQAAQIAQRSKELDERAKELDAHLEEVQQRLAALERMQAQLASGPLPDRPSKDGSSAWSTSGSATLVMTSEALVAPRPEPQRHDEDQGELPGGSPSKKQLADERVQVAADASSPRQTSDIETVLGRLVRAGLWREEAASSSEPPCDRPAWASRESEPRDRAACEPQAQAAAAYADAAPPAAHEGCSTSEPRSASGATGTTQLQNEEEDESIEAYMARLLERVRGESGMAAAPRAIEVAPSSPPAAPPPPPAPSEPASKLTPEAYVPRSNAPESQTHLSALREVANVAARVAVSRHTRRQVAKAAAGKLLRGLLTGAAGLAAAYWAWRAGSLPGLVGAAIGGLTGVAWALAALRQCFELLLGRRDAAPTASPPPAATA